MSLDDATGYRYPKAVWPCSTSDFVVHASLMIALARVNAIYRDLQLSLKLGGFPCRCEALVLPQQFVYPAYASISHNLYNNDQYVEVPGEFNQPT